MEAKNMDLNCLSAKNEITGSPATSVVVDQEEHSAQLQQLGERINKNWDARGELYFEVGKDLQEAKKLFVKYGDWLNWLKSNVPFSIRKAQRLMRVAAWLGDAPPVPHLDFTKAYILSRIPASDLDRFLNTLYHVDNTCTQRVAKSVEDMSKRELEDAVRNYLRMKNHKSSTVEVSQQISAQSGAKDCFHHRIDEIKSALSELEGSIPNKDTNFDDYEMFTNELCELCMSIIQRLSPENIEEI